MSDEIGYWFIDNNGRITQTLVSPAYSKMDLETAREVRDELTEAIEMVKENV